MLKHSGSIQLAITFFSLVINVDSIERIGHSADEFCDEHNLWGITNGKLWVMSSMTIPSEELENVIENILIPKGLEEIKDYVVLTEQLTESVKSSNHKDTHGIGKQIPGSEQVQWLSTEIKSNGNWIWKKEQIKMPVDFRNDYYKSFIELSDKELVASFNGQVQVPASNTARSGYLWALRDSLDARDIDYSECGDDMSMSYRNCVILKSKKLYKIVDLPNEEIQTILDHWFEKCQPKTIIESPVITSIDEEKDEIRVRSSTHDNGLQITLRIKELIL